MDKIREIIKTFFGRGPADYKFNLFSLDHIIPILLLALAIVLLYLFRKKLNSFKYEKNVRIGLAALIIINETLYVFDQIYLGAAQITKNMPLHLCGIAMYATAFMLLLNSKMIFEIFYFWIVCGTTNALITPILTDPGYQDFGPLTFRYYQYFIGHSLLIFFIFYMIFILGHKINFKSYLKSIVALNFYALIILFINFLIDANYMYLMGSPDGESVLDLFPPFPYNIIVLEILVLIIFFIAYLPWYYKRNDKKS